MSPVFNWRDTAQDLVFQRARIAGLNVTKARQVARFAMQTLGPGEGHTEVRYRVMGGIRYIGRARRPVDGWWVVEFGPKDAHDSAEERKHFVTQGAVNKLWRVIRSIARLNPDLTKDTPAATVKDGWKFKVEDVARAMVRRKMLPPRFNYKTFSGGDERAKHYFPKYLYPMRVLDHLGRIRFGMTSWRLK